jgi:hypothetical protein
MGADKVSKHYRPAETCGGLHVFGVLQVWPPDLGMAETGGAFTLRRNLCRGLKRMGGDGSTSGETTNWVYRDRHEQSLRAGKESKTRGDFKQGDRGYQGSIGGSWTQEWG